MSLTALEWGLRAPITPRFGGNLGALPRLQGTEPKQQQKSDLKHKNSDRSVFTSMKSKPNYNAATASSPTPTTFIFSHTKKTQTLNPNQIIL
jgi:hypothetical protein